jgi:Fe-S-cluster formation regulator IscX/YfhJ
MGYSIAQSELYLFANALLSFYGNARISDNKAEYYHKDIAVLMRHTFFKNKIKEIDKLENILPFFIPYFPEEILVEFFPEEILQHQLTSKDILQTVLNIILKTKNNDAYFLPIKDVIIEQLKSLLFSLQEKNIDINRNALPFIVKQFLSSIKIPFAKADDDKEINIQIMGFLETRILDFDNLYILSLNDDNLPGTNKTNSFIPYNLRKGFGLPTFEQFDGVNAYHFYRLLKRAKNIHLVYNNQVGDNMSEKSRFIRQIQHDLVTKDNTVNECIAIVDNNKTNQLTTSNLIKVKKTLAVSELLRQRAFSPSALKVYIKCPLQFYLKYVEKIDEPEQLEDEIDAAIFGQILHKVLELVYQPYINNNLTQEKIKSFSTTEFLVDKIKNACEILELPKEITQGSNKLQLKIIERIAQKIIENDAVNEHLLILKTEEKFIWNQLKLDDGSFATIQGTFDRIDKINENAIRIIDYKTGAIELPKFPDDNTESIESFLDTLFIFGKKDFSATFQGILYALMYYKLHNCREIYIGFHHAKNMKDGIAYLNEQQPISMNLLLSFEKRLSTLVSDIIYKDDYFLQSTNEDAYQYSVYANLLGID